MALALYDRVRETTTVTGTSDATLLGAVTGFQTFAVVGNGNTCYYTIADNAGNWEVGIGTYSTTGPTLARTTVISSSTGSKISFPSGTKDIFLTYPAEKAVQYDASGNLTLTGTVTANTFQSSGVTITGALKLNSSGGGSITLDAGVTASNYTITLPAQNGTLAPILSVNNNGIVYVNSSGAVTSATTIVYNGTSVGIGTASPSASYILDIVGNVRSTGTFQTADLALSNESFNGNDIDGTRGKWLIQEGADNLYIINQLNGKKYKFNLVEVE